MLLLDLVKMAAGSISVHEFKDLAQKMADISTEINDTWVLRNSPNDSDEVYLERVTLVPETVRASGSPGHASTQNEDSLLAEDTEDEEGDPSCVAPSQVADGNSVLRYQHHVVYSHSYCVPVLYFNVSTPDGKRLSLEELWQRVPNDFQERIRDHKWATLTQQEHPYLGTPFFMLHPCHTANLMSRVPGAQDKKFKCLCIQPTSCPRVPGAQDKKYYLVKWLSSVGPVAGLHLSHTYATAFDTR